MKIPVSNAEMKDISAVVIEKAGNEKELNIATLKLAGMLSKKLNSKACFFSNRRNSNVDIVEPDRLIPGITDNP